MSLKTEGAFEGSSVTGDNFQAPKNGERPGTAKRADDLKFSGRLDAVATTRETFRAPQDGRKADMVPPRVSLKTEGCFAGSSVSKEAFSTPPKDAGRPNTARRADDLKFSGAVPGNSLAREHFQHPGEPQQPTVVFRRDNLMGAGSIVEDVKPEVLGIY